MKRLLFGVILSVSMLSIAIEAPMKPIEFKAIAGKWDAVENLIRSGENPNMVTGYPLTDAAIYRGDMDALAMLIALGADEGEAVRGAIFQDNPDALNLLANLGVDIQKATLGVSSFDRESSWYRMFYNN